MSYQTIECDTIITLCLKLNVSLFFFLLFRGNHCRRKILRGIWEYISPKLPSFWRLMDKHVYDTSPLCCLTPQHIWFMDTRQCMSSNLKGVCFQSWRWNFKCCDEWTLVVFIYYSVVVYFCVCVCAYDFLCSYLCMYMCMCPYNFVNIAALLFMYLEKCWRCVFCLTL